ncbi:CDP-diacylglycerol--serine O-phosphatidyltransferase [Heyndrickxia acidicola]|uniref:CDP-diacylglycerol--serine O-phosphatidyltransferase n=1 Tax=Heyndrickxia acidicola TaxID=209389 RepID=A0ABU6MHY1_9BACI|nr:CDP-diacylglycerol--serine O-phosphatidyltransferase [Heyndrickxia acidicola]MED1204039.1 CDP-diacylglycerol--serine O-phosphatidyltransferase [Heyndrickxia acidicola]
MLIQLVKTLPNVFSIGNFICGVLSITINMSGFPEASAIFIFLAAFFDLFDGRIARKLKADSALGIHLDSLADIVSFGVAPALLFHSFAPVSLLTSFAFILFPTMGVVRLARFSAHPTRGYFIGVPIPAAGLILAFMGLFSYSSSFITIILAVLMVAPIKVKKL